MRLTVIGIAVGLASLAAPVAAQQAQCGQHDMIVQILSGPQYQESQQVRALTSQQTLFELFANTDTGTWTALITQPNMVTCIVAGGDNFEFKHIPAGVDG